ncbi:BTAD domain-containing putative transcriptional regulator [Amycolatopsis carbonis]|uniref:BTAD domain-containing putative transcriptional regulator n=1 Tax=Amycolatopsis carbonis TaxID=715471 RepID=A0A9Y2IFV3_9PSEU|nr:BTAD domain-containing putative transcriptional regulator [Amycolatopsis sp. 2-15]WIX79580.1 BTAD domain-containing putative transcriptional regulator [Amycolatopsis sp. 2-15]
MSTPSAPTVRFELLGHLRAWRGGRELALGPPAQRLLLTVLLARGGRPAGLDELVGLLWEDEVPASAGNVIQRYVGALRRLVEPDLPARAQGSWLVRDSSGYALRPGATTSDLAEFRAFAEQARQVEASGEAMAWFVKALDLCRATAGAGAAVPTRVAALLAGIDREVATVLMQAADLALDTGQSPQPLLPHLERVAALDPFDEGVHARLMRTLATLGRRALALEVYRAIRDRLVDELGVEPGPELAQVQRELLAEPERQPERPAAPRVRPAQLPPGLAAFTGRDTELVTLSRVLETAAAARTMPLVVIDGLAGVGKTSLAIRVGHRVAAQFPDGQLYVDLRGFDPGGAVVGPADALRGFLEVLAPGSVPTGLNARSGLYRSLLVGRRMLVVLDNVRDAEQVRPLLPGTPGCAVIVTSRNSLASLVVSDGAEVLTLDTLTEDEARRALARRLGEERVTAEPEAAAEIIRLCGRLPLALAIVAARVRTRPQLTLTALATTLRETRGTLAAFRTDDVGDVRTVFSWSYQTLSEAAARLFRLLALHHGTDISAEAAASLAGVPLPQGRKLLEELTRIRYLSEHRPDRFTAHDLVRAYSLELMEATDSPEERAAALRRLVNHYRCVAHAATLALRPVRPPNDHVPVAEPGVTVTRIGGYDDAVAWYEAELPTLTLLVRELAATPALRSETAPLALSLAMPYEQFVRGEEWASGIELALELIDGDDPLVAQLHRSLGLSYYTVQRYEDCLRELGRSMDLQTDDAELAYLHINFGQILGDIGGPDRYAEAVDHFRRGMELHRAAGNTKAEMIATAGIAYPLAKLGRLDEAVALAEHAAALCEAAGEELALRTAQGAIAQVRLAAGDLAGATEIWRTSIDRFLASQGWRWALQVLEHVVKAHTAAGDHEQARRFLREAVDIIEEHDVPDAYGARRQLGEIERALSAEGPASPSPG